MTGCRLKGWRNRAWLVLRLRCSAAARTSRDFSSVAIRSDMRSLFSTGTRGGSPPPPFRALEKIEFLQMDIEDVSETEAQSKLLKALSEVEHYMESDIEMASA